jgi:hypothetical protein
VLSISRGGAACVVVCGVATGFFAFAFPLPLAFALPLAVAFGAVPLVFAFADDDADVDGEDLPLTRRCTGLSAVTAAVAAALAAASASAALFFSSLGWRLLSAGQFDHSVLLQGHFFLQVPAKMQPLLRGRLAMTVQLQELLVLQVLPHHQWVKQQMQALRDQQELQGQHDHR